LTKSHRVFLALWPDAVTRASLVSLQHRLQARGIQGRRVPAENLHLTLAFLGNLRLAQIHDLRRSLNTVRASAPQIDLNHLGFWPRSKVLFVAPETVSETLDELLLALRSPLQCVGRQHCLDEFRAHVTLFRGIGLAPNNWLDIQCISWCASQMALVESVLTGQGARYRILHHWDLA